MGKFVVNLKPMTLEELKYPIGKFVKPEIFTPELISKCIEDIGTFPERLKVEVTMLTEQQLETPYRPDGWTIRQVVNHCADSHMNSIIRFKLALTENAPTIKPYQEALWAELTDSKHFPIQSSLLILEGVHQRLTALLKSITTEQLSRSFIHPEYGKTMTIDETIALYAWHGNHHLAHITHLKERGVEIMIR